MDTKKAKTTILIDVDGVIANFVSAYIQMAKDCLNLSFRHSDVKNYQGSVAKTLGLTDEQNEVILEEFRLPGVAFSLNPYEGAIDGVLNLVKVGYDVYFVTSPLRKSPTWCYDRDRWLIKHFGHELGQKVIYTSHKELVCGDIFIDDKAANVEKWKNFWVGKHWVKAMLWNESHTIGTPFEVTPNSCRCYGWNDLLNQAVLFRH